MILPCHFDPQPTLTGGGLVLRPLRSGDLPDLFVAASDPETWAGHPAKDRYRPEVFEAYFRILLESVATLAILDRASNRIIGCSAYYVTPDRPTDIAIGFTFLDRTYWGGATDAQVKRLMLDHAFSSFETVWFHIDPTNVRSQRATGKLGARHVHDAELAISGRPARWMCFRLDAADWKSEGAEREAREDIAEVPSSSCEARTARGCPSPAASPRSR